MSQIDRYNLLINFKIGSTLNNAITMIGLPMFYSHAGNRPGFALLNVAVIASTKF